MSLITSVGSEFQPLFRRTLLSSAIVSAWVSDEGGGALAGMEDWTRGGGALAGMEERTKMEKRICAAGSGQVMMTTTHRLTYETHTSSVGSYQCQTTCLSDHSTGTPYSTYYYALTCLSRVVVE